MNIPVHKLPDGTTVRLVDFLNGSLYSALVIPPNKQAIEQINNLRFFDYSRGQQLPLTSVVATAAHTNIPRAGSNGLPRGWEALVYDWRARISTNFDSPALQAWAAETVLDFRYRQKNYYVAPLSDMLQRDPTTREPFSLDESAELLSEIDEPAMQEIAKKLGLNLCRMQENLDYAVHIKTSQRGIDELVRYFRRTEEPLTVWCFLECIQLRPVV